MPPPDQSQRRAPDQAPGGAKPALVVISNSAPPYRVHLHRRIAREIPALMLQSVFTHRAGDFDWAVELPPEIHAAWFAQPGERVTGGSWKALWRDWRKGGRIIRHLHDHGAVAVMCNGYDSLALLRVILHCRKRGLPLFVRADSNIRGDGRGSALKALIKRRYLRWLIRRCAGILPMGTLGEQYFARYGAAADRMFRVTYEPDYAIFARVDARELAEFRRQHDLQTERRRVLYSGRMIGQKRVDLLMDAFVQIADERPNWDLVIAGDGPLKEALQARVPARLADRVRWLGFCEVPQMCLAYHACHVLALPSEWEPWALVVNEAMAAGLVVVASDMVGAAYDMIRDGVSGRIFASGSVEALEEALRDVTEESSLQTYRAEVPAALAAWRRDHDPVAGLRRALQSVNVLPR